MNFRLPQYYRWTPLCRSMLCLTFGFALTVCCPPNLNAQSHVALEKSDGKFQLMRNGKPYKIKGVGTNLDGDSLKQIVLAGGNSIRTWGADDIGPLLDAADRNGLSVCVGLWLGHEAHDFDYGDSAAVQEQLDRCVDTVRKYKDHPAVLVWGIGNEMEGAGGNVKIWKAVNAIATRCKKIDPHHPTMTVIAEIGAEGSKVRDIMQHCDAIDIVGINSYGGIHSLGSRYLETGCNKPYIVTEHGPLGPWEVGKSTSGSPTEPTSTEKATWYADGYRKAVVEQESVCLGSYAFLWGHKQETTATWFGMLLKNGNRTAAVDEMTKAWTGKFPANRCPRIESIKLDRQTGLNSGDKINATVQASDPDGDPIEVQWVLQADSKVVGYGGEAQSEEESFADEIEPDGKRATITIPKAVRQYRLFCYVNDGHGNSAVGNIPFFAENGKNEPNLPQSELPYVVYGDGVLYGDGDDRSVFHPTGYMGNSEKVAMQMDCIDSPHSGSTCLKAQYSGKFQWGGFVKVAHFKEVGYKFGRWLDVAYFQLSLG